eukprot:250481_1
MAELMFDTTFTKAQNRIKRVGKSIINKLKKIKNKNIPYEKLKRRYNRCKRKKIITHVNTDEFTKETFLEILLCYEICCIVANIATNSTVSNAILSIAWQIEIHGAPRKPMFPQMSKLKHLRNHHLFKDRSFEDIKSILKCVITCEDTITSGLIAVAVINDLDDIFVDTENAEKWLESLNHGVSKPIHILSPTITIRPINIDANDNQISNISTNTMNPFGVSDNMHILSPTITIRPINSDENNNQMSINMNTLVPAVRIERNVLNDSEITIYIKNKYNIHAKFIQRDAFNNSLLILTGICADQSTFRDKIEIDGITQFIPNICGITSPIIAVYNQDSFCNVTEAMKAIAMNLTTSNEPTDELKEALLKLELTLSQCCDEQLRNKTMMILKKYIVDNNLNQEMRDQKNHEFFDLIIDEVEFIIKNNAYFKPIKNILILNNCDELESLLLKGSWPPDLESKIKALNTELHSNGMTSIFLVQFAGHYFMNRALPYTRMQVWWNMDTRNPNVNTIINRRPFTILNHLILNYHNLNPIILQCLGLLDGVLDGLKCLTIKSKEFEEDVARIFLSLITFGEFNIVKISQMSEEQQKELASEILEDIEDIVQDIPFNVRFKEETQIQKLKLYFKELEKQYDSAKKLDILLCHRQAHIVIAFSRGRLEDIVRLKTEHDSTIQNTDLFEKWNEYVTRTLHLFHGIINNIENKEELRLRRLQLQFENDALEIEDLQQTLFTHLFSDNASTSETLHCHMCKRLLHGTM